MTSQAYGFGLWGMWGPVTDPGEDQFSHRVGKELGIPIGASPYRDYDVNMIVEEILKLPPEAPVILWGTSLGANNAPVVAAYVNLRNPDRIIHGIWGFQASVWGAKARPGTVYPGITKNVRFAHLAYSTNPLNAGLGAYVWEKAPGNKTTNLYAFDTKELHPGDGDVNVQDMFLAEMGRVIKTP